MTVLPIETAIRIHVNGERVATLMATPSQLRELAIGYLINTGMILNLSDIHRIYACDDETDVYVETDASSSVNRAAEFIAASCGSAPVDLTERYGINMSDLRIPMEELKDAFVRMLSRNERYKESGGSHTSAVFSGNEFALAEDVGRHNAQDKATGIALTTGFILFKSSLLSTGRISSDMVAKAVIAGIPILASLSLPTTLARDLAERYGITIVGRALRSEPLVLSHAERIVIEE